jgi:hypothetical protein
VHLQCLSCESSSYIIYIYIIYIERGWEGIRSSRHNASRACGCSVFFLFLKKLEGGRTYGVVGTTHQAHAVAVRGRMHAWAWDFFLKVFLSDLIFFQRCFLQWTSHARSSHSFCSFFVSIFFLGSACGCNAITHARLYSFFFLNAVAMRGRMHAQHEFFLSSFLLFFYIGFSLNTASTERDKSNDLSLNRAYWFEP